jgi:hypothetical protein
VLRHRHSALPIRNLHGELQALVTLARLKTVPGNLRAATRVAEVGCPVAKALGLSKAGARAHQGSVPAQPGGHDRPLDDDRTDLMEVTVTQDVELAGRRLGDLQCRTPPWRPGDRSPCPPHPDDTRCFGEDVHMLPGRAGLVFTSTQEGEPGHSQAAWPAPGQPSPWPGLGLIDSFRPYRDRPWWPASPCIQPSCLPALGKEAAWMLACTVDCCRSATSRSLSTRGARRMERCDSAGIALGAADSTQRPMATIVPRPGGDFMPVRQCPLCQLRFTSAGELDSHVRTDHQPATLPVQPQADETPSAVPDTAPTAASARAPRTAKGRPRWWRFWERERPG